MYDFKTKAQTLKKLKNECLDISVLPLFIINSRLLKKENAEELSYQIQKILNEVGTTELAVRSSCSKEDTILSSAAGRYESKLFVKAERAEVEKALRDVYASYDTTEIGRAHV